MRARERERKRLKPEGGLRGQDDSSAEERFYNRSIKIRKGCLEFLKACVNGDHDKRLKVPIPEGRVFEGWEELASSCGNYIRNKGFLMNRASSQVCRRWIYQFTLPDADTGYALKSKDTVGMWVEGRE